MLQSICVKIAQKYNYKYKTYTCGVLSFNVAFIYIYTFTLQTLELLQQTSVVNQTSHTSKAVTEVFTHLFIFIFSSLRMVTPPARAHQSGARVCVCTCDCI